MRETGGLENGKVGLGFEDEARLLPVYRLSLSSSCTSITFSIDGLLVDGSLLFV